MSIDETLEEELRIFMHVSAFSKTDEAKLREVAPIILPHIAAITDEFYKQLAAEAKTAKFIEGRVEHLKTTHIQWFLCPVVPGAQEPSPRLPEYRQEATGRPALTPRIPPGQSAWSRLQCEH